MVLRPYHSSAQQSLSRLLLNRTSVRAETSMATSTLAAPLTRGDPEDRLFSNADHRRIRRPAPTCDLQHYMALLSQRSRSDRKSTRLNSSHVRTSYAVFCLKK